MFSRGWAQSRVSDANFFLSLMPPEGNKKGGYVFGI